LNYGVLIAPFFEDETIPEDATLFYKNRKRWATVDEIWST